MIDKQISQFVDDLIARGVELYFEGDSLRFRAPKGSLGEEDRTLLTNNKAEVVRMLKTRAQHQRTTLPLTYNQRALWYIQQMAPNICSYNVSFSARMCSEVDPEILQKAVQTLVDRHSSLRTSYSFDHGKPTQQIHGYMSCPLQVIRATGADPDQLKDMVINAYQEPFDLEKGPLLRAHLFICGNNDAVFLVTTHHIACDGWSIILLIDELRHLYAASKAGTTASLPALKSDFAGYIDWQNEMIKGETGDNLLAYWLDMLKGDLPSLNLPADKLRPPIQTYNGATHSFSVEPALTEKLEAFGRSNGTTLSTVLLTAYFVFLHHCTRQKDILVGMPTYGRNRPEVSNLVGDLINTLALRGDLSGDPTFLELLGRTRHMVLSALEHQDYPFPLLVERLQLARDPGRSPVYQTLYIFQKFGIASDLEDFLTPGTNSRIEFGGIELETFSIPQQEGQLELVLEMGQSRNQIFGNFKYNTDLFSARSIENMAQLLVSYFEEIIMNPNAHLSETLRSIESRYDGKAEAGKLLRELKKLGVRLTSDGGKLKIDAPKGVLSENLLKKITQCKQDILQALSGSKETDELAMPIKIAPRDRKLCLSSSQERLWFLNQLDPHDISYNIASCTKLKGKIRIDLFKAAISEVIRRHESLRTTFDEVDGESVQVISPLFQVDLPIQDLQLLLDNNRVNSENEWVVQEMQKPFDLKKGPLFRIVLGRRDIEDYLLVVTIHHIIADGWSLGIFSKEFEEIYQNLSSGQTSELSELPIQYADYVYSHRLWLQSGVLEPHLTYWKKMLVDTPVLQMPSDRPRAATQQHNGTSRWFKLPVHLKKQIYDLSRSQGVTPFMTLLAAFKALLHKYSGQTDFAIGTPVANRNKTELEGLIGFFVNTLVLRTKISGDPCFTEFLSKVKETTLEGMAHQDAPFEKVVEAVNPERDMSYSPLFQVMFAFQNFPWRKSQIEGLTIEPEYIDAGTAMFDLSLYMWEDEGQLEGRMEYDSDLFNKSTIDRMLGHFEVLLGSAISDPNRRLSELELLTDVEREQILVDWNQTATDYPKQQCYHELFVEQVLRTPDDTAVICGGVELTYQELNSRANQLSRHLKRLGAGPGSVVGIYVDRTIDMAVGLLGILKSGSAYTPLDPSFPKDRIEYMLEDCKAGILLTQQDLSDNILNFYGVKVSIDSDWINISEEETDDVAVEMDSEHLAYIIYTSGSTGKPKGVQISHRALNNFLYTMMEAPGCTPQDTLISVTTMSFDIFGLELFMPLLIGARVVIAEREDTLDGAALAALIEKYGVTNMQATPSTWRLMIEAGWEGTENLKILCGGEAFPQDLVDPLLERCKELWNMYGPTETTIWSTIFRIRSSKEPILVGWPIANTQTYILDPNLQPVPAGLVGELHIGGDGMSHGYLNRPNLTREKFIPSPFSDDPKDLIYKTGDLARFRHDGMIECLGRIDHQVKLRGFRIELGEIETRIKDINSVQNSVVVIREDRPGQKRLVAYYVTEEGEELSIPELTGYLRTKLPEYMVPQQFVNLKTIPLTPNGKVDRKALPKPDGAEVVKRNYVPPQTKTEIAVSEIWKQVLKTDKPGIHDNFFELGGHSLLMAQVLNKIREKIVDNVPMIVLFQYPTIASLAKYLDGRQTGQASNGIEVRNRARLRDKNLMRQKKLRKGGGTSHG